jgi:hypothetical protein
MKDKANDFLKHFDLTIEDITGNLSSISKHNRGNLAYLRGCVCYELFYKSEGTTINDLIELFGVGYQAIVASMDLVKAERDKHGKREIKPYTESDFSWSPTDYERYSYNRKLGIL